MKDIIRFGINALSNIINGSANAIFALVLPPLLLHKMSLEEYSLWSYSLQTGALIGYLNLGVQTAVGRYVALYIQRREYSGILKTIKTANNLLYKMFFLGLLFSGLLSFIINDLIDINASNLKEDAPIIVLIVSLGYAISLLTNSYYGYFIGVRKNHIPMWLNLISKVVLGITIIAVASYGLVLMSIVFLSVNMLTVIFSIIYWHRSLQVNEKEIENSLYEKEKFVRFCLSLAVWNLGMLLVNGMNTSIVGYFSFRDVAYFTIANGLVMALIGFLSSGLNPLIQVFTGFHANHDKYKLANTVTLITRILAMIMLLSYTAYHLLRDYLLVLWMSPEYSYPVGDFIDLLIIGACIRALNIPYALALIGTENQSKALYGALFEGISNISLGILFCMTYGVHAIAYAMVVSSLIATLYNLVVNINLTSIDIPLCKSKFFSFEIVCLLLAISTYSIEPYIAYLITIGVIVYYIYSFRDIIMEFNGK
ncbi:hypothetical protein [Aeromonas sp. sia0103]|uniref:hypothetical protein n=1 Tax=Aeromonas sp. sia0103 TaxID=2854782 RepID=UPI001C475943|nr:hypothetical protein [Aeromonas sp. sia0103]MBV7598798.1 hypothetical protein [Aeromonas sp. sia0103]